MSYDFEHILLTYGGSAWGGLETWQFGLRLEAGVQASEPQLDLLEEAGSAYISSSGCKFDSGVKLEWLKVATQDIEGHYLPDNDAQIRILPTPVAGVGTEKTFPQITTCVSLTTDRSRGLAHIGRFYPPPNCHPIDASGRMPVTYQNLYRDKAVEFINAINAAGLGNVAVYSKVGTGVHRVVTGVRVGRVYDTQRRRRSSLDEEYTAAPVTPG